MFNRVTANRFRFYRLPIIDSFPLQDFRQGVEVAQRYGQRVVQRFVVNLVLGFLIRERSFALDDTLVHSRAEYFRILTQLPDTREGEPLFVAAQGTQIRTQQICRGKTRNEHLKNQECAYQEANEDLRETPVLRHNSL